MPSVQVTFGGKVEVSGEINLNIILPPKLQAFLDQMVPDPVQEIAVVTEPEPEIIKEEPEPVKPKKKSSTQKSKEEFEWTRGPNNLNLFYRTEGKKLILKYFTGEVKTTWEKMIQISNLSENLRKTAINKVLSSEVNKPITSNKESAVNVFIRCLDAGLIKDPTKSFIEEGINPNVMKMEAMTETANMN